MSRVSHVYNVQALSTLASSCSSRGFEPALVAGMHTYIESSTGAKNVVRARRRSVSYAKNNCSRRAFFPLRISACVVIGARMQIQNIATQCKAALIMSQKVQLTWQLLRDLAQFSLQGFTRWKSGVIRNPCLLTYVVFLELFQPW
jgi:hypothetical protein